MAIIETELKPQIKQHDRLTLRVPASVSEGLDAIAKKEGNGTSSVVRRLLTRALETEE